MPVWGRVIGQGESGRAVARLHCANLVAYLEHIQDHRPVMAAAE